MSIITTLEAQYIKQLVTEALEEAGLIQPFLTRKEIVQQIGRHRYEKGIKAGHIKRNKFPGKNAQVRVLRAEFVKLINLGKI